MRCKYGDSLAVQLHCILVILHENQKVNVHIRKSMYDLGIEMDWQTIRGTAR